MTAHCYAYWIGNTFSQDQYSQVRISNVGPWNGVIARAQSAIDRFYMAFVFGPNDYRIYLRKDGLYYSLSTGKYGDVGGWRHYPVGGSRLEPGATDVAAKRESGFDLHGHDREPHWRQPGDRDLFADRATPRN